jgi:DNA-binding YbaB/EbfC family protein
MPDIEELLRQARMMQLKMAEMQEELGQKTVEASSGGGMVRVVCTGKQEIRSIAIEKSIIDPNDADMLQDLVVAAVNNALRLSRELGEGALSSLTGGLKIPGLF